MAEYLRRTVGKWDKKMTVLKKANSLLKRFKHDESGVAALTWSLSLTAIIGAMGAAMDFAVLSNADARSQTIADNTALAAAIYVKTNGRAPEGEGELHEGIHKASDLGYDYKSFVVNGSDGVDIEINYDDNAKEVTATVTGKTNPILMQILGFSELDFKAKSVVSYLDIQNKFPASIALILDNSGSMQFDDRLPLSVESNTFFDQRCWVSRRGRWVIENVCEYDQENGHDHGMRDPNAQVRLDGLKSSVIKFQSDLRDRLGEENDGNRKTLRMGMLPYSSAIIASGTQPMDWGYLEEGTNNPNDTTGIRGMRADGGTNSSPPMSDAEVWMSNEDTAHSDEAQRTQTEDKEALKFVVFMTDGQNSVGGWTFTPGNTGQWHRRRPDGAYWSISFPAQGYQEGTVRRTADIETEEACESMKDDGVQIFTIGYALEDFGFYRVNGWSGFDDDHLFEVEPEIQTAAYNLMTNCASSPDHFITAANADQLEAAFDEIQNAIVEELIRIKA